MVKARKWVKAQEFSGPVKKSDFKLVEETLPELKDGEILFEAVCLTVDPYMRMFGTQPGETMTGQQVAKVTASKNDKFPVGSEWVCLFGWRTHTIWSPATPAASFLGTSPDSAMQKVLPLPPLGKDLPHSLALGTIGMPGATAYIGLLDYGELKSGETVLVNGAAGAVGSVVGQIAKIKGCTVIGYAGTEDKVKWLKEELGFDFAFNYKKVDLSESIKQAAPEGVDVYFDNVGGDFSNTVITKHMKMFGRVALIGSISGYNATSPRTGPELYLPVLSKMLSIRGFEVPHAPKERWIQGFKDMIQWLKEGKLKYREHITKGFDKMPEAFMELFTGANTGKAIVKVSDGEVTKI